MENLLLSKEPQKVSNAYKTYNNSFYTIGLATQIEKSIANDHCTHTYYNFCKVALENSSSC